MHHSRIYILLLLLASILFAQCDTPKKESKETTIVDSVQTATNIETHSDDNTSAMVSDCRQYDYLNPHYSLASLGAKKIDLAEFDKVKKQYKETTPQSQIEKKDNSLLISTQYGGVSFVDNPMADDEEFCMYTYQGTDATGNWHLLGAEKYFYDRSILVNDKNYITYGVMGVTYISPDGRYLIASQNEPYPEVHAAINLFVLGNDDIEHVASWWTEGNQDDICWLENVAYIKIMDEQSNYHYLSINVDMALKQTQNKDKLQDEFENKKSDWYNFFSYSSSGYDNPNYSEYYYIYVFNQEKAYLGTTFKSLNASMDKIYAPYLSDKNILQLIDKQSGKIMVQLTRNSNGKYYIDSEHITVLSENKHPTEHKHEARKMEPFASESDMQEFMSMNLDRSN